MQPEEVAEPEVPETVPELPEEAQVIEAPEDPEEEEPVAEDGEEVGRVLGQTSMTLGLVCSRPVLPNLRRRQRLHLRLRPWPPPRTMKRLPLPMRVLPRRLLPPKRFEPEANSMSLRCLFPTHGRSDR